MQVLTVGQYLRPTERHLPIVRYWHPDEFAELERAAYELGFEHVAAGPLVRSSLPRRPARPPARARRRPAGGGGDRMTRKRVVLHHRNPDRAGARYSRLKPWPQPAAARPGSEAAVAAEKAVVAAAAASGSTSCSSCLFRIAVLGHGLGALVLIGLFLIYLVFTRVMPGAQRSWSARNSYGPKAKRRVAQRATSRQAAAAEAAEDDPAFAADAVKANAAALFKRRPGRVGRAATAQRSPARRPRPPHASGSGA